MSEILMIAGMALVTFSVRYPVLALVGRLSLPHTVVRGLRYVPPVVLTAIIVPAMLLPGDASAPVLTVGNAYLWAGIIAALVAWRSKNLLATIITGMVVFLLWTPLLTLLTGG